MAEEKKRARSRRRVAVILVHGIGEQLPMETLREFAAATWSADTSQFRAPYQTNEVWSKPDPEADNFEMRRLVSGKNSRGIQVDFYEFYWAHLMSGTELERVWEWLRSLLFRWPAHVPKSIRWAYYLLWCITALSLLVLIASSSIVPEFSSIPSWLRRTVQTLAIVTPALSVPLIRNFVGDAARYLHPSPKNVAIRNQIRKAGVELFERVLDSDQRYGRVMVVGHSLGSVIAYDILSLAWAAKRRQVPAEAVERVQEAVDEVVAQGRSGERRVEYEALQSAWQSILQRDWPVTDFFSIGSPLAHADSLIEKSSALLRERLKNREMPSCPPVVENRMELSDGEPLFYPTITYEHGQKTWLHHATVFLPTRWTNLYFSHPIPLFGDPIGGPVSPLFGAGVREVCLPWRARDGVRAHTSYWSRPKDRDTPQLVKLRELLSWR